MKIKSLIPYVVLSIAAIVTRLPLLEKYQSHWDGTDYSIAIIRYSLEEGTPTTPGYPLYIALGKFLNIFVNDPHSSIVLVSVFASAVGAIAFYIYGLKIYNKFVGLAAATIFLTGSPFYFFTLTPYGYALTMGLIVLVAFISYRIFILKKQDGIIFGIVLGLFFGIRPQEMILLGPLALLGFVFLDRKNKFYTILIFVVITLLWFLPLVKDSGGFQHYIDINFARTSSGGFMHPFLYNLPLAIKGLLLSFGISIVFLAYYPYKIIVSKAKVNKKVLIFYSIWIIPGVIFNLFIRGEHAGYQISYLSAILIIISFSIWAVTKKKTNLFYICLTLIAIFNLYWFFYDRDPNFEKPFRPTSFHYSDIRKNDLIIGSKVNYVNKNFDPKYTLLVGTEAAWRQYAYYLKDFQIVALNALNNREIPYIYNKYTGQYWNQEASKTKDFSFEIPENVKYVVLMDTPMNEWVEGNKFEVVNLPGNSRITVVEVNKNSKMLYDYHFIKIVN